MATYWPRQRSIWGGRLETMPRVTVNADSNGAPGQVLYTLENPSNIVSISSTPSDFTFSAPAQARLTAGRTYWIVIHSTGRAMDLRITESDAEDDGKQAGWIIGDGRLDRNRRSSDPWSVPAAVHYPPGSIEIKLVGHLVVTTINEPSDQDFPNSNRTWGIVGTDWTSSGRLSVGTDYHGDTFVLTGLEPSKTYRVEVVFNPTGSIQRLFNERYFRFETVPSSPTVGGNIHLENCCYLDRLYPVSEWDSNYDGAAIFDFYTGWGESGSSRWVTITPGNSMRPNIWFYGEYTLTLTDVTGLQRLVSNTNQRGTSQVFALVGKNIALESNPNIGRSTAFTTGSNPSGYTLDRITAYISMTDGTSTGAGVPDVAIHSDGTDKPGTKFCDLRSLLDYDTSTAFYGSYEKTILDLW